MALRRQDVIISCVVLFISWTIISTLIPTIRHVPYAFLLGFLVATGAILFLLTTSSRGSGYGRPILSPSVRSSYLSITSPQAWPKEIRELNERAAYDPPRVYGESQAISSRIDGLINLILRDFLRSWYIKLSGSAAFTNEVDRALRGAFNTIVEKITAKDLVDVGVTRLLPIINTHIKDFSEAERLVRGKKLNTDITETEELDLAIATKYRDGRVHPAASLSATKTAATQQHHMRRVIGRLLTEVLPENMTTSASVLVLVREILACAVLVPVLSILADPDMLNQLIENYGRSVLYERKTVRKLRAALDEHATPLTVANKVPSIPSLGPDDSERAFERFIRAVRHMSSLTDARRCRSEVLGQLKRSTSQNSGDSTYLRRLEIGRKVLDQRIAQLLRSDSSQNGSFSDPSTPSTKGSKREMASLRAVLYDAPGLSYFMEFMDRQHIMSLVQFWVVVDGMRSPLDVGVESVEKPRTWTQADRNDIVMISEAHAGKPELNIPKTSQKLIRDFIAAGSRASWDQYVTARKAILSVQEDIYQQMNDRHFPAFKQSDLYYKWITSDLSSQAGDISFSPSESTARARLTTENRKSADFAHSSKLKDTDLRRAVASTSDLRAAAHDSEKIGEVRRSLDAARPSLFGDDNDDADPLSRSIQSLNSDPDTASNTGDQTRIVAAVQAALDNIVDEGADKESLLSSWDLTPLGTDSPRDSSMLPASGTVSPEPDKTRPSLASLGLVGTPTRPTVFNKGDLFGEGEKMWQDDGETSEGSHTHDEDDIHEAAPGDLGLAELVQSLSLEIDKLEAQQSVVDALTQKAELTNNAAELRILRKSKTSLEHEIHRKELQRQQYMVQQSENDLYGRATIAIKRIIIGTEEDGHEFALYVIEVQRQVGEKAPTVSWAVAKRYSEFHDLHKRLRTRYPLLRELDFPRRQIVLTLQKEFLKKRRAMLERYLRELLDKPDVCRSLEFRAFLSQQAIRPISKNSDGRKVDRQDFITRIYNSVTDGMEEFLGNVPVLDQLSVAGQNIISAATALPTPSNLTTTATGATIPAFIPSTIANDPATALEAEAEMTALDSAKYPETTSFIKPLCDTFVDLFQLHQGNNWLRGRAVVVVLQQLLGGTIERKVRDAFRTATAEPAIARYIDMLRVTLWPNGRFRTAPPVRTPAQKAHSKREAGLVLAALLPEVAGGVVGRSNAAKAARTVFATINNERLNQALVYSVLDEAVEAVFGVRVVR